MAVSLTWKLSAENGNKSERNLSIFWLICWSRPSFIERVWCEVSMQLRINVAVACTIWRSDISYQSFCHSFLLLSLWPNNWVKKLVHRVSFRTELFICLEMLVAWKICKRLVTNKTCFVHEANIKLCHYYYDDVKAGLHTTYCMLHTYHTLQYIVMNTILSDSSDLECPGEWEYANFLNCKIVIFIM